MEEETRFGKKYGKIRKLKKYNCQICAIEMWEPTFSKKRFCGITCVGEFNRRTNQLKPLRTGKNCSKCKEYKELSEFGYKSSRRDGTRSYCLKCEPLVAAKFYQNNKDRIKPKNTVQRRLRKDDARSYLLEWLLRHPCIDCGETDPIVLDMDHVVGTKSRNIAQMMTYKPDSIKAEMEKCVVRCANCHRRKTSKERNWISRTAKALKIADSTSVAIAQE